MGVTREELIKIAREAASGTYRPSYCDDPAEFVPHEWVLEAMQLAYNAGLARWDELETELEERRQLAMERDR